MDAQVVFGAVGATFAVGTSIVAVAVHASNTRAIAENTAKDVVDHDHKLRNFDNWRLNILPTDLSANFARKGEVASELKALRDLLENSDRNSRETLKRIEQHQEMMAQRFMNGGAGMV